MNTEATNRLDVHIRWMIRRDMPEVLEIEKVSFKHAMHEEDFLVALRQRNCIGMVCERKEKIVGFMVYELHKDYLKILDLAVHPAWRHLDVGTQMCQKLASKLSSHRRRIIRVSVRESDLPSQLFFRSMGYLSQRIIRESFEDTGEDAYLMECHFQKVQWPGPDGELSASPTSN